LDDLRAELDRAEIVRPDEVPHNVVTMNSTVVLRDLDTKETESYVDLDWPHIVAGTGVTPLSGEAVRIALPGGRSLALIGVTIRMSRGTEAAALERLVRGAPAADIRIVFGHNPNFVAQLREKNLDADLVLAGHTHGGQVVLPLIGAPITKMKLPNRYASGLHDYDGVPLHVSAGIGMERGAAPQIRFRCPPEICLLELR
jgi:hypothetical protein